MGILRLMVSGLGDLPSLSELKCLLHTDPEADFFFNITHLQVHRRIRAMAKLRQLCDQGSFSKVSPHTLTTYTPPSTHLSREQGRV